MANIIKRMFTWAKPIKEGVYHYRNGGNLEGHRVHLRVESNGSGLLIIDADKILYLNQTAAEMIKGFLDGKDDSQIAEEMVKRYRARKDVVSEDITALRDTIKRFAEATDVDPVTTVSDTDISLFTGAFSAPHRMDLILTYNNSDIFREYCYNIQKDMENINYEQWKRVIEILWNIGVPHILFAGGEPTKTDNFVNLIRFAENMGIVTGLLTDGVKLADMKYTNELVDGGLDHLQITIESRDSNVHNRIVGEDIWDKTVKGLMNALATPLYCVAHTTFTRENIDDIPRFISFLKEKGVYAFAADALTESKVTRKTELAITNDEKNNVIKILSNETKEKDISFVWYGDKIEGEAETSQGWEYSMCIEPNGDVTPCEFEYKTFGNILKQEWREIWKRSIKYSKEQK
jgi:MoaA/NifB/PqqE/SkfB family radical SAM enzyme